MLSGAASLTLETIARPLIQLDRRYVPDYYIHILTPEMELREQYLGKTYSFHPFLKMMEYTVFLNKFKNSLIGLHAMEDFNGKKVPQS